jgi:DNA repair photolyase
MPIRPELEGPASLRWSLAAEPGPQGQLFEQVRHEVGRGEFRGMEFLEVEAKRLLNEVKGPPGALPFRWTVNPYRGCSHSCSYCLGGDTPILMADGRTKPIRDLRVGDRIYGTERRGSYRRYVITEVLDHWETMREAWEVHLADDTKLVASADHRFLSNRGWKHVAPAADGQRPFLTLRNSLTGIGHLPEEPKEDEDYRRGYLCGMVRGDGTLKRYDYSGRRGRSEVVHRFRLALTDLEALDRAERFLELEGEPVRRRPFPTPDHMRPMEAIVAQSRASFERVGELIAWPDDDLPSDSWFKGFLAGIFDAEGSTGPILRIYNSDPDIVWWVKRSLQRFAFDIAMDRPSDGSQVWAVRVLGGLRERMRFYALVGSAITRKRTIDGVALKSDADLRVVDVRSLGVTIPMFDITTGTGDFIADGVVSHNCFARGTHTYLGLDSGQDFDQRIVVKANAVERLKAELHPSRWRGELVALGTNTDPYQRCEGKYRLTRGIVGVLLEANNPFSILTKSTLILRDVDLLGAAARRGLVRVSISIGTVDEDVWRATEPGTPAPSRRLRAVEQLNAAGIPTGVLIAPILPGVSDAPEQLAAVAKAVVDAGAVSIGHVVLHLRSPETRAVYLERTATTHPEAAAWADRAYTSGSAPKAVRARIAADLRAAIEAAGGHLGDMEPPLPPTPVDLAAARRRRAAEAADDQLTFAL